MCIRYSNIHFLQLLKENSTQFILCINRNIHLTGPGVYIFLYIMHWQECTSDVTVNSINDGIFGDEMVISVPLVLKRWCIKPLDLAGSLNNI